MKALHFLLINLCLSNFVIAQKVLSIKSLSVGDTVPNITITNVTNYPASDIQLSDLKGKLVILDFWGRHCAPCILALPKLDSLQEAFEGKVQIIAVSDFISQDELIKTLARFKQTKNLKLPLVLENALLSQYFAHRLVSHIVWIDGNSVIRAITGSDYITKENIRAILSGEIVTWPVKQDLLDFDFRKPLLEIEQPNIPSPGFLYYSTLTAHLAGIAPPNGTFTDSVKRISITSYYNATLLSLCNIALNYPPDNRVILDVKDINRYKWNNQAPHSDWYRENTYCYSIKLPLTISPAEIKKNVQADLLRWLNILGIQIKILKIKEGGKKITTYTIADKG